VALAKYLIWVWKGSQKEGIARPRSPCAASGHLLHNATCRFRLLQRRSSWALESETCLFFGQRVLYHGRVPTRGDVRLSLGHAELRNLLQLATVSTDMPEPSEPPFLERLRAGDLAAFEELYMTTFAGLWRFANAQVHSREVAEEIVHDVFTTVWLRREALDIRGSIEGYLYGAVRRRAMQVYRHERVLDRTNALVVDASEGLWRGSVSETPEELVLIEEIKLEVNRAVEALPETARAAITLRWNHNLDYKTIGEVLGMSADAVRMQVSRAQATLRAILKKRLHGSD
jgi:RNA polymerase sigma-70 factor, ECF subfamily